MYTWDAADRLIGATLPGATSSMEYDGGWRRTKTIVNGTTTNYLWDELSFDGDVALETDATNLVQTHYILAKSELLLQKRSSDSFPSYFLKDGQNSTRALASGSNGDIQQSYNYDAYGNLVDDSAATPSTRYLYTGQQYDFLTQLYSLRARYYNVRHGWFMSRDLQRLELSNPTEINKYPYVAGNPVNNSDPTGYSVRAGTFNRVNASSEYGSLLTAVSSVIAGTPSLVYLGAKARDLVLRMTADFKIPDLEAIHRQVRILIGRPNFWEFTIVYAQAVNNLNWVEDYLTVNAPPHVIASFGPALPYLTMLVSRGHFALGSGMYNHAERMMVSLLAVKNFQGKLTAPQDVQGTVLNNICSACRLEARGAGGRFDPGPPFLVVWPVSPVPGREINLVLRDNIHRPSNRTAT